MFKQWEVDSMKNHAVFLGHANAQMRLTGHVEVNRFLTLAICGEAGELANLVKKEWRGDELDGFRMKAMMEMADIYIYLHHLARNMGFDLDDAAAVKVDEVAARLNHTKI